MNKPVATASFGLALLLAACGGSANAEEASPIIVVDGVEADATPAETAGASDDEVAADSDAEAQGGTETMDAAAIDLNEATDEELALAFADCLRSEGIDVSDPTVNADGTVSLQSMFGDGPPGGEDNEGAFEACGEFLQAGNFGPGGGDFDQVEAQDQLVEFASCLRDQGLDVNDPDLSGGFPGAGGGGGPEAIFGIDIQDPQYADQLAACQGILAFGPGAGN